MPNKKNYNNNCFSPNWVDFDLETLYRQQKEVIESCSENYKNVHINNRKESLETRRRKDLNTLLRELEEIKQNIETVAEKQQYLANLMNYYSHKDLVQ